MTLLRRGSYRLGALRVRTGDPFGFFSSEMVVGQPTRSSSSRRSPLPHWRLPPSPVDGTTPTRRRYEAASPLVIAMRPYVYGDAINRIHWLSSVRHGELKVKEFDLEQAADLWLLLDLERAAHAGRGRVVIGRDRGHRRGLDRGPHPRREPGGGDDRPSAPAAHPTPDRGTRVEQKILHLLANVQADGSQPLAEVVLATLPSCAAA